MRLPTILCLLALSLGSHNPALASAGDTGDTPAVEPGAEPMTAAQAYLAKVDTTLALAADGQYGNLRRGSDKQLAAARETIAGLLEGRQAIDDLSIDDRMTLQNAEDTISSILRNNEKDRVVCRRDVRTGTRFASTECMTVGEREARSVAAGASTLKAQQNLCIPGEGSSCI